MSTGFIDTILAPSFALGIPAVKQVAEGEKADLYIWCEIGGRHERDEDGEVIDCEECVYSPTPRKDSK